MKQPWYKQRPRRLRDELLAGQRASETAGSGTGAQLRWLELEGGLVGWEGQVEVQGTRHFLRILYPRSFPMAPPWVIETEPFGSQVMDDRATYHQLRDGSLCLYTLGTGPRSWSPDLTVLDVLARYREFRELASAGAHVDDHGYVGPRVAGLPVPQTLVMTPGQAQALDLENAWGRLELATTLDQRLGVVQQLTAPTCDLKIDADPAPWSYCGLFSGLVQGFWLRVPAMDWRTELRTWADVDALIARCLAPAQQKEALQAPVLVLARGNALAPDNVLALWRSVSAVMAAFPVCSSPVQVFELAERLFARVDGALPGRALLAETQVVMVGLGSLGSAVAVQLARAGISRFHLFDPERLEPENIVRHVGDLTQLYQRKVEVVAAAIRARNPLARIDCHASSPLWDGPGSSSGAFQDLLDEPGVLVIVTTADDQVERAINDMAVLAGAPAIYGSVLDAAEHGRIFRVIPGQTACYQCVLDAQAAEPARYPSLASEQGGLLPVVGPYRQPGIPGVGFDIEQVALHTSRLALQTIGRRFSDALGYPDAHGDHLLWTSRGGWAFDHPLQVRVERYPRRNDCSVCGTAREHEATDAALATELEVLRASLSEPGRMAPEVPVLAPR